MLFYQAVEAERFWLGSDALAPEAVQRDIYHELLERM